MKVKGVRFRKIEISDNGIKRNPNQKNLKKQIRTLNSKIKKKDKSIITTYVIEKDNNYKNKYHTHLIIKYNDEKNLYNQLSRFVGGTLWNTEKNGLETIVQCNGKYGEVSTHEIYDEPRFLNYLNKQNQTKTLV